jgi:hypothetical protein
MSSSAPDFTATTRHDQLLLGCGVLVFIASFLPWYGVKFNDFGGFTGASSTTDAWHGLAAFGLILLLASLIVTAAERFAKDSLPEAPVSYAAVSAGLACVGAACVIIKSFDLPSGGGPGFSVGLRWGGWLLLILVVAQAVLSVLKIVHANDGAPAGGVAAPDVPPV